MAAPIFTAKNEARLSLEKEGPGMRDRNQSRVENA